MLRRLPIRNRPNTNSAIPPSTKAPMPTKRVYDMKESRLSSPLAAAGRSHEGVHDLVVALTELVRRAARQDAALVQHQQLVTNRAGAGNVVCDHHQRRVLLLLQVQQQIVNLAGGDWI